MQTQTKQLRSCSNYYCEGYKFNTCARALEHRRKLFERKLDDVIIPKRSNSKHCELHVQPNQINKDQI